MNRKWLLVAGGLLAVALTRTVAAAFSLQTVFQAPSTDRLLSRLKVNDRSRLPYKNEIPGVYETVPFKSIVIAPNPNIDKRAIVQSRTGPGTRLSMPTIAPQLRLIPRTARGAR